MQNSPYDIIIEPVITEKSTELSEQFNKSVFVVSKTATKPLVKKAVEEIFQVKVESVNIVNLKGKTKTFRGRKGKQSDVKKAIVTLSKESKIDNLSGEA